MKEQVLRRAIGEQQTDKPYGAAAVGDMFETKHDYYYLSGTLGNWRSGSGQKKKLAIEETDSLVEYLQLSLQEMRVPAWKKGNLKTGHVLWPMKEKLTIEVWRSGQKIPYQKITIQETGSPVEYLKLSLLEMLWGSNRKRSTEEVGSDHKKKLNRKFEETGSNEEAGFGNKKILTRK